MYQSDKYPLGDKYHFGRNVNDLLRGKRAHCLRIRVLIVDGEHPNNDNAI